MPKDTPGLAGVWAHACAPSPAQKRKQTYPFSIRLTNQQRKRLQEDAKGKPLGVHVRSLLFEDDGSLRSRNARPVADAKSLAKALGMLGQSRLSSNLNQLAKAANSGALPVTPEVCRELMQACEHVSEMRLMLVRALGLRR